MKSIKKEEKNQNGCATTFLSDGPAAVLCFCVQRENSDLSTS